MVAKPNQTAKPETQGKAQTDTTNDKVKLECFLGIEMAGREWHAEFVLRDSINMKIIRYVLVLPFLMGSVAWSAPDNAAATASKAVAKPFPKTEEENHAMAEELLTHGLDAYDAAKSFQGAFIVTMTKKSGEGKTRKNDITEVRMRTSWRVNEQGDKTHENTLTVMTGKEKGKTFVQTIRDVDNGEVSVEYVAEENKWTQNPRNPVSTFRSLFRPIINAVAGNLINNPVAEPFVEQGIEGGVPVYIVRDKEQESGSHLRVLFDASNRSLRSLSVGGDDTAIEVSIFDRKFNQTLPDSVFEWKAPVSARQVPAGTLKPKGFFGNSSVN